MIAPKKRLSPMHAIAPMNQATGYTGSLTGTLKTYTTRSHRTRRARVRKNTGSHFRTWTWWSLYISHNHAPLMRNSYSHHTTSRIKQCDLVLLSRLTVGNQHQRTSTPHTQRHTNDVYCSDAAVSRRAASLIDSIVDSAGGGSHRVSPVTELE